MTAADIDRMWRAIRWLSSQSRGGVAVRVWACLWTEADLLGDYRVKADRKWIADKVQTSVGQVSRILTLLVDVGAIRRQHNRRTRGQLVVVWMIPDFDFPD